MNAVKEFMKGLPESGESRVLSSEEQEMVGGGPCDGVSCKNSCAPGRKKVTEIKDNSVKVASNAEEEDSVMELT